VPGLAVMLAPLLAGLNLGRLCEAVRSPPGPRTARHPVGTLPRQQVRLERAERPGEYASPDPGYSRTRHMHRPPRSPGTIGSSAAGSHQQPAGPKLSAPIREEPRLVDLARGEFGRIDVLYNLGDSHRRNTFAVGSSRPGAADHGRGTQDAATKAGGTFRSGQPLYPCPAASAPSGLTELNRRDQVTTVHRSDREAVKDLSTGRNPLVSPSRGIVRTEGRMGGIPDKELESA
jgi:hypothetical protein